MAMVMLTTVSTLISKKGFRRFETIQRGAFMRELSKDRQCPGSVSIIQALIVERFMYFSWKIYTIGTMTMVLDKTDLTIGLTIYSDSVRGVTQFCERCNLGWHRILLLKRVERY